MARNRGHHHARLAELRIVVLAASGYFERLWRRAPKAMSFADFIEHIGTPEDSRKPQRDFR